MSFIHFPFCPRVINPSGSRHQAILHGPGFIRILLMANAAKSHVISISWKPKKLCYIGVAGGTMREKKIKFPKKGAAKRISEAFNKIRKQPIPKEAFDIVERDHEQRQKDNSNKKIANPSSSKDA